MIGGKITAYILVIVLAVGGIYTWRLSLINKGRQIERELQQAASEKLLKEQLEKQALLYQKTIDRRELFWQQRLSDEKIRSQNETIVKKARARIDSNDVCFDDAWLRDANRILASTKE